MPTYYGDLNLEPAVSNCVESIASEYEEIIAKMQDKFDALYSHCCNLASDIKKKDDIISALYDSEKLAISLSERKETMVKSLLAMVNKERKVKIATWFHNITHEQVAPTQAVRQEMASAASRVRMKEQSDGMVEETADSLAKSYSPERYDSPSTTNMSNARLTTDFENLPATVPMEMLAIWFHHGVEELTPEEEVQYEKYLQQQVRPPSVALAVDVEVVAMEAVEMEVVEDMKVAVMEVVMVLAVEAADVEMVVVDTKPLVHYYLFELRTHTTRVMCTILLQAW